MNFHKDYLNCANLESDQTIWSRREIEFIDLIERKDKKISSECFSLAMSSITLRCLSFT